MLNISISLFPLILNLTNLDRVLKTTVLPSENLLYLSNYQDNNIVVTSSHLKFIYSTNGYQNSNNIILNINLMVNKIDVYILNLKQSEDLGILFVNLTKMRSWNPRAKFIIILEQYNNELLNELFKILSNYYIYNVIVASNDELFTYFPYKYENLNKPCLDYEKILTSEYFPNKIPKLWRNTTNKQLLRNVCKYQRNLRNQPVGERSKQVENIPED